MNRANRNLATLAAILRDAAAAALSEFEVAAIDAISARRAELGDEIAMISPAEITLLLDLVAVMKKHLQDQVADRRGVFDEILARMKVERMEADACFRTGVAIALEAVQ